MAAAMRAAGVTGAAPAGVRQRRRGGEVLACGIACGSGRRHRTSLAIPSQGGGCPASGGRRGRRDRCATCAEGVAGHLDAQGDQTPRNLAREKCVVTCCTPHLAISDTEPCMSGQKIRNMEEFARVSGISRPTVSKYFNDPGSVRTSTRERIEKALERFEYRPNIYAVNQNRRLTKNIGIVVPFLADPFFAEIARNIERRCIDAGFSPTLFSAHGDRKLEIDILDSLRSMKPAGVLLAPLGRASDREADHHHRRHREQRRHDPHAGSDGRLQRQAPRHHRRMGDAGRERPAPERDHRHRHRRRPVSTS
jgi:transcriptional regulator with XRE-family HTH domain